MSDWQKTLTGESRLGVSSQFENRHIIGRDTPIDGGVYIGSTPREALVVDTRMYGAIPRLFEEVYRRSRVYHSFHKRLALDATYSVVDETFRVRDNKAVDDIVNGIPPDSKVAIDSFIDRQVGVCRHIALTTAAILEMLTKRKLLGGKVSLDRNSDFHPQYGNAGHAWTRYTNYGLVWIIDVAQGFQGPLEEGMRIWNYSRPGERINR